MDRMSSPDPDEQLRAIEQAVAVASGVKTVWVDTEEHGLVREGNEPWCELRMRTIVEQSEETTSSLNETTELLDVCQVLRATMEIEAVFRSRTQEFVSAGWYAGARAKLRLRQHAIRDEYFAPNNLGIQRIDDLKNMPTLTTTDGRIENNAVLELFFNSTIIDSIDAGNSLSYIERVELSSEYLKNAAGENLDDSLQITDEVIP